MVFLLLNLVFSCQEGAWVAVSGGLQSIPWGSLQHNGDPGPVSLSGSGSWRWRVPTLLLSWGGLGV